MVNQFETNKEEKSQEGFSIICWVCFRNTKRKLGNCHHLKRIKGENIVNMTEFKNSHPAKINLPHAS